MFDDFIRGRNTVREATTTRVAKTIQQIGLDVQEIRNCLIRFRTAGFS